MASTIHSETIDFGTGTKKVADYVEFADEDGQRLADMMLSQFGSKRDAFDECLIMLIMASPKQDLTTMTACRVARKYMRAHGWDRD